MAKYLTARGVDESRVLLEEQASDTRENLEFSRTLAQTHGMRTDRVLIITSDFHLCRAKYLAKKLGMEPYGLASRTSPEVLRVNYLLRGGVCLCEGGTVSFCCRPWRQVPVLTGSTLPAW